MISCRKYYQRVTCHRPSLSLLHSFSQIKDWRQESRAPEVLTLLALSLSRIFNSFITCGLSDLLSLWSLPKALFLTILDHLVLYLPFCLWPGVQVGNGLGKSLSQIFTDSWGQSVFAEGWKCIRTPWTFCICGIVLWLIFWGQIVNGESLKKTPTNSERECWAYIIIACQNRT